MRIDGEPFGRLSGIDVQRYRLYGGSACTLDVTNYGARILRCILHDGGGDQSVVYGFQTLDEYVRDARFHGATIGRYANRIARGRIRLDAVEYELSRNENDTTLHGGPQGFDRQIWRVVDADQTGERAQVEMHLISPAGDQGFPGTLSVHVRFSLTPDAVLRIDYRARSDASTYVNLTNHAYWNLRGSGSGRDQRIQINAARYTPVDTRLIPTGELASVQGTAYDFRAASPVPPSLDTNFVLDNGDHALTLSDPHSRRTLTVSTTEPGVQVYSGFDPAVAIETQHFPDSPHHPNFPTTLLRAGETIVSHTRYAFTRR